MSEGGEWLLIQTAVGAGIAGRVAQTGSSLNISDPYACEAFNPSIDRATNFLTKSLLCCPIADISGKHVAVIQVSRLLCALIHLTAAVCAFLTPNLQLSESSLQQCDTL